MDIGYGYGMEWMYERFLTILLYNLYLQLLIRDYLTDCICNGDGGRDCLVC